MVMRSISYKVFFCLVLLFSFRVQAAAQEVSASTLIESKQVYVGEPFMVQIKVSGHGSPSAPILPAMTEFEVTPRGGQSNSRSAVTIINGRVSQIEERGYIFNYRFVAKKSGILSIPPIQVNAGGQTLLTNAVRIRVQQPQETKDFKLRVKLSSTSAYVGEAEIRRVWCLSAISS